MTARTPGRGDPESGQVMLLTIGVAVLALVLVLGVASVSALHLERKRLLSLADGAAAAAADALDEGAYYALSPGEDRLPISDASVLAAVEDYLDSAPPALTGRFEGLAVIAPTGTPDGRRAEVTLAAVVRPPFVPWQLLPGQGGVVLEVTSRAEARPR